MEVKDVYEEEAEGDSCQGDTRMKATSSPVLRYPAGQGLDTDGTQFQVTRLHHDRQDFLMADKTSR